MLKYCPPNTVDELRGSRINGEPAHYFLDWAFPEIYAEEKSTIVIGLCHTRAADPIRIYYDGERDGWGIEQGSTFIWDGQDKVCDPEWEEVAFVRAWARDKEEGASDE
jgi:hypothetical protein